MKVLFQWVVEANRVRFSRWEERLLHVDDGLDIEDMTVVDFGLIHFSLDLFALFVVVGDAHEISLELLL